MKYTDTHRLKTWMNTHISKYSRKLICLFLAVSLCLSHSLVWAIPQITGAPATIQNKQSITVSGSGFGTKAQAAPAIWDDFEWGNDGDFISTGGWVKVDAGEPEIDTGRKYGTGSRSAYGYLTIEGGSQNSWKASIKTFGPSLTAYVSFMLYWSPSGATGRVFKPSRINSGAIYSGEPAFKVQVQPEYDWYYGGACNGSGSCPSYTLYPFGPNAWHRIEYFLLLSDPPGASNGYADAWIDLKSRTTGYNPWPIQGITRVEGNTNQLNIFQCPHMWADPPNPVGVWMDDVYVDTTRARVEIGNASTWEQCTHREIQIPTAWSNTSITFTANQGSFADGDTAYLYVVDENGNVNEQGYPVRFGTPQSFLGDVNQDSKVDIKDLILVAKDFGNLSFEPACDLNGDGKVDIKDLIIVAKNFGKGVVK